jgi:hypothetical protein
MFDTPAQVEAFVLEFESGTLPKARWSHHAHLVVGLWYLAHHAPDEALALVRQRIRAYNESQGTANTDSSGYHETLTRLYMRGIADHQASHAGEPLTSSLAALLNSPVAEKAWPLSLYSRERLFSVEARRSWVEPDLDSGATLMARGLR